MECVQNLLLGDPVYDERGQLVRREYGLKNALALFVLGYVAYTLYISMGKKVFSGKRKGKMKGGGYKGFIWFIFICGWFFIIPCAYTWASDDKGEWRGWWMSIPIGCIFFGFILLGCSYKLNNILNPY